MLLAVYVAASLLIGLLSASRSTTWAVGMGGLVVFLGISLNTVINNWEYVGDQRGRLGMFVFESLFHYALPSLVVFLIPFGIGRFIGARRGRRPN